MGLLNQLVNYYKCLKPIKNNDYVKNCLIKISLDKVVFLSKFAKCGLIIINNVFLKVNYDKIIKRGYI